MIHLADEAEEQMMAAVLAHDSMVGHLYTDAHVADASDTPASFTEMAGHGYTPLALPAAAWVVTPGGPTLAQAPEQVWAFPTAAAPVSVYGVFFTWATSGKLAFSEPLAGGPFVVANAGDLVGYTPRLTLRPEV